MLVFRVLVYYFEKLVLPTFYICILYVDSCTVPDSRLSHDFNLSMARNFKRPVLTTTTTVKSPFLWLGVPIITLYSVHYCTL